MSEEIFHLMGQLSFTEAEAVVFESLRVTHYKDLEIMEQWVVAKLITLKQSDGEVIIKVFKLVWGTNPTLSVEEYDFTSEIDSTLPLKRCINLGTRLNGQPRICLLKYERFHPFVTGVASSSIWWLIVLPTWNSFRTVASQQNKIKANGRRKKNWINGLEDIEGIWVDKPEDIFNVDTNFFSSLFNSSQVEPTDAILNVIDRCITTEDNTMLRHSFTADEVLQSFSQINPNKAPSIDDLSSSFWDVVGNDLVMLCLDLLNEEAKKMKELLTIYELSSGQKINYDKSSIFFSSNAHRDHRRSILWIFGVDEKEDPSAYLELLLSVGKGKIGTISFVKEKTTKRIQGWTKNLFSFECCKLFLKFVAQALPTYAISCYLLPK
ncbi:hypothetical protein F3Y22_tig00110445pilonHSYRG00053 [Hibiscus syriacus]|uniref:Uncharacterized protein n=1 Tax=Hibiscus syriacus TaxID=106335 RepID=A0A6A3AN96_HIBSY|nr:hypothetical protein F3Y22_tig00110445pilonHSYRG00053 [Hibiscus syriacus]